MSETLYKILAFSGGNPGPGPGPQPEPILPPDLPWVRPANYPDLESIVLDSSNPEVEMYFTCDKAFAEGQTQVMFTQVGATSTITAGHIENNQFVGDYPPVQGSTYGGAGYTLADINEDVFVIKIAGPTHFKYVASVNTSYNKVIREAYIRLNNQEIMFQCRALYNAKHIKYDLINSSITSMSMMFDACYSLYSLDLSNFDTRTVTDMSHMFRSCYCLNSLDLSSFDTGNVTDMRTMFQSCYSLQSIDLSSFVTTKVTSMNGMFSNCYSLPSLDLSHFDTGNVTNMEQIFYTCYSLVSLDISSFDTSNVTSIMTSAFTSCYSLVYVVFPPTWKLGLYIASSRILNGNLYRSSVISYFNSLQPTETATTLKFAEAVRYKLTAEDIAIAQNKGYTIAFT